MQKEKFIDINLDDLLSSNSKNIQKNKYLTLKDLYPKINELDEIIEHKSLSFLNEDDFEKQSQINEKEIMSKNAAKIFFSSSGLLLMYLSFVVEVIAQGSPSTLNVMGQIIVWLLVFIGMPLIFMLNMYFWISIGVKKHKKEVALLEKMFYEEKNQENLKTHKKVDDCLDKNYLKDLLKSSDEYLDDLKNKYVNEMSSLEVENLKKLKLNLEDDLKKINLSRVKI